jgi:hypothetical protein
MAIPTFPFDFEKHFVQDVFTPDCLGACLAMCARYWRDLKPNLSYATDLAYWQRYLDFLKVSTPNGINTIKLTRALQKMIESEQQKKDQTDSELSVEPAQIEDTNSPSPLIIQPCNFQRIEDALRFFNHNPPVPLILFYDESLSQTNEEGYGHAVLLHSFDTVVKENIYFIDPFRHKITKEFPMNLAIFNNGWKAWDNLVLAVYPRDMPISINAVGKSKYPTTLLDYVERDG